MIMPNNKCIICTLLCFITVVLAQIVYDQNLPNCTSFHRIHKRTKAKAGACVMIKDEEGFLSEYVAYYVVHGVDHLIFYDDQSSDNGLMELEPWIAKGYASVRKNWEGYLGPEKAVTWGKQMHQKKMMERDCKMHLHHLGFDYHISVDIDEYSMPMRKGTTLVDAVHGMFKADPTRGVYNVNKLQFQPTPHLLEPIDRLTIEAYQTRFHTPNKFSPRQGVMKKTMYRLHSPHYSNATLNLVLQCCTFHSCRQGPLPMCWQLHDQEIGKIFHAPWPDATVVIFHYARSLEKFTKKQKTWTQHVQAGYGIEKFFDRLHGWTPDSRMLRYSCQVRELISEVTGVKTPYIRPGEWRRSYEVGKNPFLYQGSS